MRPPTETSRLLQEWLDRENLSQEAAAERLGTNRRNIVRWISGANHPQRGMVEKLASKMGLQVEDFYPDPQQQDGLADAMRAVDRTLDTGLEDTSDRLARIQEQLSRIESLVVENRDLLAAAVGGRARAEALREVQAGMTDDLARALETSERESAEAPSDSQSPPGEGQSTSG